MERDYTDKIWVYNYVKDYFIAYCDNMDVEYPRSQWEEERVFYREWLALANADTFPENEARDLLMRMKHVCDHYGTHFEYAINQIGYWIEANTCW